MTWLAERWSRFWFPAEASLVRLGAFRIGVMGLCLMDVVAYGSTALRNAAAISGGAATRPWRPIYLFEVLGLGPIDEPTARVIYVLALVFCGLGMLGVASRVTCALAGLLVLYWTGLVYSFGKVHHEKVALAFTVLALPLAPIGARLSLDSLFRRLRGDPLGVRDTSPFAALPIRLCMVSVAIGYCAAGLTKLVIAGPSWANGYTLMAHLMHYHNDWSEALCQSALLCQVMSVVSLTCQVGFPLVLILPASRWVLLPAAVGFHITTWFAMDTGPYMTLWFLLIAFLPLEQVPTWLLSRWRRGGLERALGLATCVAPGGLVLFVLSHYFPWWSALLLAPGAWALCQPLLHPTKVEVIVPGSKRRLMAWLAALDWSGRLRLSEGDVEELRVVDQRGEVQIGARARRSLRTRLALPLV